MPGFIRPRYQIGFTRGTLEAAPTNYPKADEIYFCLESALLYYLVIYVDVNKKKYYTVQNSNNTSGGRGEIIF